MKKDWAAIVGWTIFWILMAAILLDRYIFNPFIFGFAYYVFYVFSKTNEELAKTRPDQVIQRLIMVGVIALIYLWFSLSGSVDKDRFVSAFEKTCYSGQRIKSESEEMLCESIQSHIDSYLVKEPIGEYW